MASDLSNYKVSRMEQAASARKAVSLTQTYDRMLSLILSVVGSERPYGRVH